MPNHREIYPIHDTQGIDSLHSEYDELFLDDDDALAHLSDVEATRFLTPRLRTLRMPGVTFINQMECAREAHDALEYLVCLDKGYTSRDERIEKPDYVTLLDTFTRHNVNLYHRHGEMGEPVMHKNPRIARKARVCAYYLYVLRETDWYDGLPEHVKTFDETYYDNETE